MKLSLKKYSDRLYLLLFALLISLPFSIFLNSFLIGLLFINTFTAPASTWKRSAVRHPLAIAYLAFFAVYAISLLYTENLPNGLRNLETKLSFLIMPIVLATGVKTIGEKRKRMLLSAFCIAIVAAALFSLGLGVFEYFATGSWYRYYPSGEIEHHHLFYTGLSYPLMHPGYYSVYVGSAIFILWLRFLRSGRKWLPITGIAFLLIFLILLQGRINIIAFVLISFTYLLIKALRQGGYKRFFGIAAALVAIALLVLPLLPPSVKERFAEPPDFDYDISADHITDFSGLTIRFAEWRSAMPVIQNNFWTGVGAGDAHNELMKSYEKENFRVGLQRGFNSHNQFLQTLVATGILGLIPLLAMLVIFLWVGIKGKNTLLVLLTLYFFLSMLTESMLERHWAVSLFCSLLLYLGLHAPLPTGRERTAQPPV